MATQTEPDQEKKDLYTTGKAQGIKYFMFTASSFNFGSKGPLVPLSGIRGMQKQGFMLWTFQDFRLPDFTMELSVIPDPDTLIQFPWDPTYGWLSSDLFYKGDPSPICPRGILRKQIAALREHGLEVKSGMEVEFMMLDAEKNEPTEVGGGMDYWVYFDPQRTMKNSAIITSILDALDTLGWEPTYALHEVAPAQLEVNYKYTEVLQSCDRYMFLKFMIQQLALKQGQRATFMPLVAEGIGNGLHIHQSLWSTESGESIVADPEGALGLSQTARYWLGGIMKHLPALTAISCSQINSYKRLHAIKNFLHMPAYSVGNKFPAVRVVDEPGVHRRFEIRIADPAANPYLLQAAIIACGLDGIDNKIEPDPKHKVGPEVMLSGLPEGMKLLPATLQDALGALKADDVIRERLGDDVINSYISVKENQVELFNKQITPFEKNYVELY